MPFPLHVLPLSVAIIVPVCCIAPYLLAGHYGHVSWFLPYISDAGGKVPESSLFSQLLDVTSLLIAFTVYIRFKQISVDHRTQSLSSKPKNTLFITRFNRFSLLTGLMIPFGVVVVGNYRMPEILWVHLLGAIIAFGGGTVYLITQAWLSFLFSPRLNTKRMAQYRAVVASFAFLWCNLTVIAAFISFIQFGRFPENDIRLHWSPNEEGYWWHIVSAIAEWMLVMMLSLFAITFYDEFRKLTWSGLHKKLTAESQAMTSDANGNISRV